MDMMSPTTKNAFLQGSPVTDEWCNLMGPHVQHIGMKLPDMIRQANQGYGCACYYNQEEPFHVGASVMGIYSPSTNGPTVRLLMGANFQPFCEHERQKLCAEGDAMWQHYKAGCRFFPAMVIQANYRLDDLSKANRKEDGHLTHSCTRSCQPLMHDFFHQVKGHTLMIFILPEAAESIISGQSTVAEEIAAGRVQVLTAAEMFHLHGIGTND